MYVNQIAETLNVVFEEVTGTYQPDPDNPTPNPGLYKEDMSNFIDAGRWLEANGAFKESDFDHYVGKLIDIIGKTIIVDKSLELAGLGLLRDKYEFGALLQKIRVGDVEFTDTEMWKLQPGQDYEYFTFSPVDVKATYYSDKTTYSVEWSWIPKVLKESFRDMSKIIELFSAIENRIKKKIKLMSIAMEMRLVNNANGININHGKVINILEEYQKATGDTATTAAHFLSKKECLQSTYVTMSKYKAFLGYPTKRFNVGEELNWTNKSDLHCVVLTDLEAAMGAYLLADTYHNEFVKLSGYATVACWQGIEDSAEGLEFDMRSSINITTTEQVVPDVGEDPVGVDCAYSGIIGCMFDNAALAVMNEEQMVDVAPKNPKGKFVNYYYSYDQSNYYDDCENFITFVLSDYSRVMTEPADWDTNYTDYFYLDDGEFVQFTEAGEGESEPDFDDYQVYKYLIDED